MNSDRVVYVVDDDATIRESLRWLMESVGLTVRTYDSAQRFLRDSDNLTSGCLLLDVRMRDMSGLELQRKLREKDFPLPIIFMTGYNEISVAVEAMKYGAVDFVVKSLGDQKLLDAVQKALLHAQIAYEEYMQRRLVTGRLAQLSNRERQVLHQILEGKLNKSIAAELGISVKTVEAHRARIMKKMGANNLADLFRQLALAGKAASGKPLYPSGNSELP